MPRPTLSLALASLLLATSAADIRAQEMAEPAPMPPTEMDPAGASGLVVSQGAPTPRESKYGFAARARWITVPSWFLNMFTQHNQPLSSYGYGLEGFMRRYSKDDPRSSWELVVGIGYQNMSPADGNWLGSGKKAADDTDWVQFKNFGLLGLDAAYIARQYFNDYFGIHYGAGLGLGVVTGKILRTSSANCTTSNLDNSAVCKPRVCKGNTCTEKELAAVDGTKNQDSVENPHRFKEGSVPAAIPILNLLVGVDFRIPQAKGLELRLEGGFFDAFFLGMSVGYQL